MGKKSSKSTTNTVTNPWSGAVPSLKGILGEGQDIYGGLGDPNRFTPQIQQALQPAQQVASGDLGIGTGGDYRGLLDRLMQPGQAESALGGMIGGPDINPYFQEMLDNTLGRVGAEARRGVSAMGRYGSGLGQGVITDRLGEAATGALGTEWGRAQQQQMQALGLLGQAEQGRLGLQGSAIQGLTGVEAQNIGNQLVGGQQSLAGINALQSAPWNDLRNWASLVTPIAGLGGSSSGTSSTSNPAAGLGAGLALASFL